MSALMFVTLSLLLIVGVCGIGLDTLAHTIASTMHYLRKIRKSRLK
jgi:Holliday junction resolvasome RuvABC ATP-dependent DNA helicase subunit